MVAAHCLPASIRKRIASAWKAQTDFKSVISFIISLTPPTFLEASYRTNGRKTLLKEVKRERAKMLTTSDFIIIWGQQNLFLVPSNNRLELNTTSKQKERPRFHCSGDAKSSMFLTLEGAVFLFWHRLNSTPLFFFSTVNTCCCFNSALLPH